MRRNRLALLVAGVVVLGCLGLLLVLRSTGTNQPVAEQATGTTEGPAPTADPSEGSDDRSSPQTSGPSTSGPPTTAGDRDATIQTTSPQPTEPTEANHSIDDPNSIWIVVNKQRPLDRDDRPDDLVNPKVTGNPNVSSSELSLRAEAATAIEDLFAAAQSQGHGLLLGSGFRDYDLQAFYYNNIVKQRGQAEADRVSARPGTSEHQTGLTADVSPASTNCYLETCFADTPEGIWVSQNAHRFGFIIRYPQGKEPITGYSYEPWHIRYVGTELAAEIHESGDTLEEHFDL